MAGHGSEGGVDGGIGDGYGPTCMLRLFIICCVRCREFLSSSSAAILTSTKPLKFRYVLNENKHICG